MRGDVSAVDSRVSLSAPSSRLEWRKWDEIFFKQRHNTSLWPGSCVVLFIVLFLSKYLTSDFLHQSLSLENCACFFFFFFFSYELIAAPQVQREGRRNETKQICLLYSCPLLSPLISVCSDSDLESCRLSNRILTSVNTCHVI